MDDAETKYPYNGNQWQCTICDYKSDNYNWLQVLGSDNPKRDERRIKDDIFTIKMKTTKRTNVTMAKIPNRNKNYSTWN